MTNNTQKVWNILDRDMSIQKNMARGLINTRALAKHIIQKHHVQSSIDSTISAIRRYNLQERFISKEQNLSEIFTDSTIATKNNLVCLVLRKITSLPKYLKELHTVIDSEKGETLRIIKGKETFKLIVEKKTAPKIQECFKDAELLKENLSEIRITASEKADLTKGVAARIGIELALNNINLSEIIFCVPEILIYVEESDLLKAHESIVNICKS